MSSLGLVSTAREGGSQLWAVNGREVSMVRGLESSAEEESERRREEVNDKAAEMGFTRLYREEEEDEAKCERAISICYKPRQGLSRQDDFQRKQLNRNPQKGHRPS